MATPDDLGRTFRQHDALTRLEAALRDTMHLLFPRTQQALRAHISPKKETPAVAAAGVSGVPTSLDRSEAMQTLPQPPRPATPLVDVGTAQHTALLRWHNREPLHEVFAALSAHPTYPLVPCNPQARSFAPGRGTPRPAA
jgi:hypothetical protein